MASSQTSYLIKAPVEVLAQIASYLETPDYCALRLTCKHVEAALFHPFAKEFFTRRQFMLTEFSLQALLDISKSRLAPSVEYLTLSTDRPLWDAFRANMFRHDQMDDYERALQRNRFTEEYESHTALITTGRDYELLLEGITALPNLQTLGLRDFHSNGRYRDGHRARWRPYGSTTLFKATSIPTNSTNQLYRFNHGMSGGIMHISSPIEEAELNYLKHLLITILRVIGAASPDRPILRLEVILRRLALNDHSFAMATSLQSEISSALRSMKALFFDLCTMAPPTMIEDDKGSIKDSYHYHLLQLLSSSTNVEHLRLNCKDPYSTDAVTELYSWLVSSPGKGPASALPRVYPGLPQLPPPIEFPHLHTVELGFALIEPIAIFALCTKLKGSLRAINLHKVNLRATKDQVENKVNLWARLLQQISNLHLALNSIVLGYVGQGAETYNLANIKFHGQDEMRWSGTATSYGLKDLVDALEIVWPQRILPDPTMTEDEDDDENGDEDEEDEDEDEDDDTEGASTPTAVVTMGGMGDGNGS